MTRSRARWLRVGLVALALGGASPAFVAAQESRADDLAPVAARLISETRKILAETGIPAISIALARDGDVAWARAFRMANIASQVPATPETHFSTGSTFKFVTATAVMWLIKKGAATLDTPLDDIVGPDPAIDGANDVTLRHLLSHPSGLRGPVKTVPLWSRIAPLTPEVLLSRTTRVGAPGVEYRYCNECYALLGYVIEKLSARSFDDYIADNILGPLGVEVTHPSVPSPDVVERMALPYDPRDNRPGAVPQVRYDVFAAGAIPGFNSISVGEPARGLGVYIMSNSGQSSKAIGPLARLAMRLM